MDKREKVQRAGLNKWVHAGYKGILNWATGVGKSYAAVLAIKNLVDNVNPKAKILIVGPTTLVLDNFIGEFIKFKYKNYLKQCKFICYHSITKEKDHYDLVVLDEIHHVTSDKRMGFFDNVTYDQLLGLSASLTDKQKEILKPYCRVVDVLSLYDVSEEGFVSKFTVINVPIELTKSEKEVYKTQTEIIDYTYLKYRRQAWSAINKRSGIITTASNKIKMIDKIVDLFPNQYGIIFSLKKEYSEEISERLGAICTVIHSGHSKKQRRLKLKNFKDGRTKLRLISTPLILDEGATVPRLSFAILASRFSKKKQFIQSLGRIVRAEYEDKHAIAIRLYCKGTVEEKWVKNSQEDFETINVENYEQLCKTIKDIQGR